MMLNSAVCQIILGGTLGLGLGPIPQFGMRGVAAGSLIAYTISIAILWWYLLSGRARVAPKLRGLRIQRAMFFDILKVGLIACLVVYCFALEPLGFLVASIPLMLLLLRAIDPVRWPLAIPLAVLAPLGVWWVLKRVLLIQLPAGIFDLG